MYRVIFIITLWLLTCKRRLKSINVVINSCMLHSNQMGGWSTEGLTVDRSQSNEMSVTCIITHLTSFAVLVSVQDERPVRTE